MIYNKDDYNSEPVHYCSNCLSLNIRELTNSKLDVCGECGNINIEEAKNIEQWNELFNKEYGRYFLSTEQTEMEEE